MPSGNPTGIRVVSRDDWPITAVVFPRSLVGEVQGRKEVQLPGVYLLAGVDTVHIGSGNPVGEDFMKCADNVDSWGQGLFIMRTSALLTIGQLRHIKRRLGALVLPDVTVSLAEANFRSVTSEMPEEQYALVESFLRTILQLLPLIRYGQFETAA